MKTIFLLVSLFGSIALIHSQGTPYEELPNPARVDTLQWERKIPKSGAIGWGSTDIRYQKHLPPALLSGKKILQGWRGERVFAQVLIANGREKASYSYEISSFRNKKQKYQFQPQARNSGFVRYVLTDELNKDKKGACGHRKKTDFDSLLVADVIDPHSKELTLGGYSTQPLWVGIDIPADAPAGTYKGVITLFRNGKRSEKLPITLEVAPAILRAGATFHLDLWQNPYAIARYYGVTAWSEAHLQYLKREMQRYAEAGGKVITTSIVHRPWNGQTQDPFDTMVRWIKKKDGSWAFDYSAFDTWVRFMHEMGVDKQINCYSMVPWELSFQYYDEATETLKEIKTAPKDAEYKQMWGAMLKDFARHLKERGWFAKTHIAMDERPMEVMLEVLQIIKDADKDYKIALAGALHEELLPHLDDYCVALRMKYAPNTASARRAMGRVTTYYTSCEEPSPNTFTFSAPAESEWLGWYAFSADLDGYLRWALNSWTTTPLQDSQFRTWGAGDTYLVYPEDRSSVRFERLLAGIQAFEKLRYLESVYKKESNTTALQQIETIKSLFSEEKLKEEQAGQVLEKAHKLLQTLPLVPTEKNKNK